MDLGRLYRRQDHGKPSLRAEPVTVKRPGEILLLCLSPLLNCGWSAREQVLCPPRVTLEYEGKIWPQRDRENAFAGVSGGEDGSDIQPSPL